MLSIFVSVLDSIVSYVLDVMCLVVVLDDADFSWIAATILALASLYRFIIFEILLEIF